MKNVRTICFALVVLFLCDCPALGTIDFKDGLTHNVNYAIYDNGNVRVDYQAPSMYTTVNWLDGGRIYYPYGVIGYEHSRINVRGGYIYRLVSFDSSQVNISGGSIDYHLYSYDSSQVDISGGSISNLVSWHSSQVNISGGSINGDLYSNDSSQVDIFGGLLNGWLASSGSSQVNISGGLISDDLILWDQSKIQIFGSDFTVDGLSVGFGELTSIFGSFPSSEPLRHLTGELLSGGLIDSDFLIGYDARIILIPEPASAVMLGLGGIFFAIRRKQR